MTTNNAEIVDKAGDFAILPVPQDQRKGFLSLLWVNAGYTINLGCIFGGAAVAMYLPLGQTFMALLIAAGILGLFGATIGGIGAKYGVSTSVLSRQSFGRHGSWLVGAVLAITLGIGWFGWQVAVFAETIHTIFPGTFLTNQTVACIWGAALMILTASFGFKGLGILSFIVVPMIIVVFLLGIVASIDSAGTGFAGLMAQMPEESGSLAQGITMAVGIAAAGSIGMADITRYGKKASHAAVSGPVGYLAGALFCEFAGAIMVVATKLSPIGTTPNLIQGMVVLGMGVGALVTLIFAQWTTNDNNLYSGSLGLTNIFPISKRLACVIMGVIGLGIALARIQDHFVPFLIMLGLIVPPFGGVILSDFFLVRLVLKKEYKVSPGEIIPSVNLVAIVSVIAAALISKYWVTPVPGAIMAILLAFVIHAILSIVLEKAGVKYKLGKHSLSSTGF